MKKGYLETGVLLLLVYICWGNQSAMARHHHSHHLHDHCRRCPPGFGVSRPCDRHWDTTCHPCAPDHFSSRHSKLRPCYPCSRCGLGLYVAHACTSSSDTVCDSCHTYRGPHNKNFVERCINPLRRNETGSPHGTVKDGVSSVDVNRSLPPFVVIGMGVSIAVLAVVLLVSSAVAYRRTQHKRVNQRHSYEAVATKEAVML